MKKSLFLILITATFLLAATADEFYNKASGFYLQGRMASAINMCEKGLGQYPQDANLKKLKERIEQNKDSQKKEWNKKHPENPQNKPDNKPENKPENSNQPDPNKNKNNGKMPGWDDNKALNPDDANKLLQGYEKEGKDGKAGSQNGKSGGKDW
jgi:hypothetical protein